MQASEPISSSSLRYISENIQFSRMKNAILPQVSSQVHGYDDFISEAPVQFIDNKINAYNGSFYMDSSLYTEQDPTDHHGAPLQFCSQSYIDNYQSGPSSLMTMENLDCFSFGDLSTKSPTMAEDYDNTIKPQQQQLSRLHVQLQEQLKEKAICSTKKHSMEDSEVVQKRSPEIAVVNKASEGEMTSNKKRAVCCQEQLQDYKVCKEIKELHRERVHVRRSQKLAHKITALQKLVSPYGKTDTASVLHEAFIFIKFLQEQIENMFQELSFSADNYSIQLKGEKELLDLRNKGLCLVPLSLTWNLIKEDAFINQY